MKADPSDARLLGMRRGCATSGSGRGDGLLWPVSLFGERAVSSPRPTFQTATRAASVKRGAEQPGATRSALWRAWRGLRAPDLDRREHDATMVVGRDLDADQAWVVRRFGLTGGGAAGSGLRRDGPSMRMVMQWCCNRSINASTSGFLSNNPYQSGRSRLVVMIVETRL
jgi:hypothetical protein